METLPEKPVRLSAHAEEFETGVRVIAYYLVGLSAVVAAAWVWVRLT